MIIEGLKIRKIFATNSKKTIEIELETKNKSVKSSVPMGTSAGSHEAASLPVDVVVSKFSDLKSRIVSKSFSSQEELDGFLKAVDGTNNFSKLGGNLSLSISSAFLKASALDSNQSVCEYLSKGKLAMPKPLANVIGAKGLKDIEEYLIFPKKQKSLFESVDVMSNFYTELGKKLKGADKNFNFGRDLESAWRCSLTSNQILEILGGMAEQKSLAMGLDVASSEMWDGTFYSYSDGKKLSGEKQLEFVEELIRDYKLGYMEDPFQEDDFELFSQLSKSSKDVMICGDDLVTTNVKRLRTAVDNKSVNCVIVKPNQIGTITDTMEFVKEAKRNKITTVMSHRSGETEDVLICHMAVGLGCDYVKFGISGERTVKLNEMIRIEEILQNGKSKLN